MDLLIQSEVRKSGKWDQLNEQMDGKLEKVREFAASPQAYRPPKAVNPDDSSDIQDLDEIKLHATLELLKFFAPQKKSFEGTCIVSNFLNSLECGTEWKLSTRTCDESETGWHTQHQL